MPKTIVVLAMLKRTCRYAAWMPPEALLKGKFTHKSSLKSDAVWSFAVLMWEIYTCIWSAALPRLV